MTARMACSSFDIYVSRCIKHIAEIWVCLIERNVPKSRYCVHRVGGGRALSEVTITSGSWNVHSRKLYAPAAFTRRSDRGERSRVPPCACASFDCVACRTQCQHNPILLCVHE